MQLKDRIKELEEESNILETSISGRKYYSEAIFNYADEFLNHLEENKTFIDDESKGIGIYDSPISDDPIDIKTALSLLKENVDKPGINPASGGHLGYIPGGGIYLSSLADYLVGITNRYAGIFFASPGAVRMENMLLKWMANLIGYPETAGGNLTSGGSISNLTAIATARDAHNLSSKDFSKAVVYLTEQVHHSIDKALRIAGLNDCIKNFIPMDEKFRMRSEALETAIKTDNVKGLKPWLIVASAGTTDTGSVDPISEIGDISQKYNLWFHVDGAYGAFFILTKAGKEILKGLEKSDSLVMDPHKGLFLPYGTGAVLVKDKAKLYKANYYQANYMQDALDVNDELSPADLSPELSKHFRGLRLWLPLKLLGLKPFKSALEEKIMLARYFYEKLNESEFFETGNYPDLSIVTFRLKSEIGYNNELNKKLFQAILQDGRVFFSSTIIDGKFTLRAAILSFRTHLKQIDLALIMLNKIALQLLNNL